MPDITIQLSDGNLAQAKLQTLLQPRIEAVERGETVPYSMERILEKGREKMDLMARLQKRLPLLLD